MLHCTLTCLFILQLVAHYKHDRPGFEPELRWRLLSSHQLQELLELGSLVSNLLRKIFADENVRTSELKKLFMHACQTVKMSIWWLLSQIIRPLGQRVIKVCRKESSSFGLSMVFSLPWLWLLSYSNPWISVKIELYQLLHVSYKAITPMTFTDHPMRKNWPPYAKQ